MPRHATVTSYKPGINPKTGAPAMNEEERKQRRKEYYYKHRLKTQHGTWKRQIGRLGCTPEMYAELREKQGGVCAICKRTNKTTRQLAVDHDHTTGKIRGLLCQRCNTFLGQIEDRIDVVREMEKYLCLAAK